MGLNRILSVIRTQLLDLDGQSMAVRIVFRVSPTSDIPGRGFFKYGPTLIGKRDGGDFADSSQGKGWNISFDGNGRINVLLYDGFGGNHP